VLDDINPEMVVLAREARGMTQRELATATKIKPYKLSRFENSIGRLSGEDISAIAYETRFRRHFFNRQDRLIGLGSSLLFNRRQKTTPIPVQRQVQARVNIVRIQVERMLVAAEMEAAAKIGRIDVHEFDGDPRAVARQVRAALRMPMGPVQNMTYAIEACGGVVTICHFGARQIDAAHVWLPGHPPMFFMNADRPGDRHRFNLAHELAHAVMHDFPSGDIEQQANEFASEFLMPTDEIGPELCALTIERAAQLKQRWKVSMSALIYNAHRLGCISERRYRTLYATLRSMLKKPLMAEPIDIKREEPVLVRQLVQLHRKTLGYNDEELRDLFMMDDPEFLELGGDCAIGAGPLRMPPAPLLFTEHLKRAAGE
jgi:Zn-dependent peptidase ImmA (M78 family)/transcriptional regulator with XRE-family HTH domain